MIYIYIWTKILYIVFYCILYYVVYHKLYMLLHYIYIFFWYIYIYIYIYICVKSLQDPIAIQHMAMHVMFRRDLNELKVSRKAERPNVRPRVGLSAFALVAEPYPGPANETCRMTETSRGLVEKMKTQERRWNAGNSGQQPECWPIRILNQNKEVLGYSHF